MGAARVFRFVLTISSLRSTPSWGKRHTVSNTGSIAVGAHFGCDLSGKWYVWPQFQRTERRPRKRKERRELLDDVKPHPALLEGWTTARFPLRLDMKREATFRFRLASDECSLCTVLRSVLTVQIRANARIREDVCFKGTVRLRANSNILDRNRSGFFPHRASVKRKAAFVLLSWIGWASVCAIISTLDARNARCRIRI